jgi:hypothetical protein
MWYLSPVCQQQVQVGIASKIITNNYTFSIIYLLLYFSFITTMCALRALGHFFGGLFLTRSQPANHQTSGLGWGEGSFGLGYCWLAALKPLLPLKRTSISTGYFSHCSVVTSVKSKLML